MHDWWTDQYYAGAAPPTQQPWFTDVSQRLSHIPDMFPSPAAVQHTADKASSAADTIEKQANQFGDDSRRTLLMAQASIISANKQLEETSQHVQSTAKTVKYVVIGIGGLAGVALLFHILRESAG